MDSLCFGCWSREPCGCSAAWKTFCAYARDEKWRAVLPMLASNLRIAAGLQLARNLANAGADWTPGCHRPAPGWREG